MILSICIIDGHHLSGEFLTADNTSCDAASMRQGHVLDSTNVAQSVHTPLQYMPHTYLLFQLLFISCIRSLHTSNKHTLHHT